jgi:homospermidine synthase
VSSCALIEFCHERGALYLDTCIEPWPGGYTDKSIPAARRTNYALRETALALRQGRENGPTAVLTHGANPGMVSHFVKQAMLNIAADTGVAAGNPQSRADWAAHPRWCQFGQEESDAKGKRHSQDNRQNGSHDGAVNGNTGAE